MVLGAVTWLCTTSALHAEIATDQSASATAASDKAAQVASKAALSAASAALAAASAASSAESAVQNAWVPPSTAVLYLVPLFALLGSVVAMQKIVKALLPTTWSLADALSETVSMPAYTDAVAATATAPASPRALKLDNDGKAVLIPEMHASSSRVIAMMGMMAILFLFLGFGVFAIFEFGATGKVPATMNLVVTFLTSGLTLFAPYLVNQFASVFKLAPGK